MICPLSLAKVPRLSDPPTKTRHTLTHHIRVYMPDFTGPVALQVEVLTCECAPQKHPFGYLHSSEECPLRIEAAQAPWFTNLYGKTKVLDCDAHLSIGSCSDENQTQTVCSFCGFLFKDNGSVFDDAAHKHEHFPVFDVHSKVRLQYSCSSTKKHPKGRLQSTQISYGTCHKRLSMLGITVKKQNF